MKFGNEKREARDMFKKEEFLSMMSLEGLECFEGTLNSFNMTTVILKNNTLEELVKFARVNNIKSIFYNYIYYDVNSFLILNEQVEEIQKDIYELIEGQIEEYNKQVISTDFSRPNGMNIFCVYQGQIVSVRYFDFWVENDGLLSGKQKLQQLIENNNEIKEIREKKLKEEEDAREKKRKEDELLLGELRKYILTDPEFTKQVYPGFRRDYIRAIFTQRKETQKFRHLLFDKEDYDYVSMRKAVDFIEILWREKNNL
jgi:hypothetical protein